MWLEGDNRLSSYDSRDHGTIPLPLVQGRVWYKVRGALYLEIKTLQSSKLSVKNVFRFTGLSFFRERADKMIIINTSYHAYIRKFNQHNNIMTCISILNGVVSC